MSNDLPPVEIDIYGTAPTLGQNSGHFQYIGQISRLAEEHKFEGLLIRFEHSLPDPWIIAAAILQQTNRIRPLIALQPYSLPPFTAAKMIHSLTSIYGRRIDVNLITGGKESELNQVANDLDHDSRFNRALEYMTIVRMLLSSNDCVNFEGEYYTFRRLQAYSQIAPDLHPRIFVPGSSPAGLRVAHKVGGISLTHPEPIGTFATGFAAERSERLRIGIRVGLIARQSDTEAWEEATGVSSGSRAARIQALRRKDSESDHIRRMAEIARAQDLYDDVYWTVPYKSGKGYMPFLVGSYEKVAAYLRRYLDCGVSVILLGGVATGSEFCHARNVMSLLRGT
ncbi:LLM class flavin-dependent oxidoreductase [Nonomuraea sp. NPDC004297]